MQIKAVNMDNKDFQHEYIKHEFGLDELEDIKLPDEAEPDAVPSRGAAAAKSSSRLELYDWVQCIIAAVILAIMIFIFVGRVIGVKGDSMYPTLHNQDRVITSNIMYTPKQGDIVVFKTETYGNEPLVKRVIATAGQKVDIDFTAGVVYVDGEAVDDSYTYAPTKTREDFKGEVTVPDGCVFVMGDNRNDSTDSRSDRVGMVDTRMILGKVHLIIIPGKDLETGGRFFSRIGSPYN